MLQKQLIKFVVIITKVSLMIAIFETAFQSFENQSFVSWHLGRLHWGNADGAEGIFGSCRTHVGCSPVSGPTLKKALCCTCQVVGRRINKVFKVLNWR